MQGFYSYAVRCRKHNIKNQYLWQSAELTNADFTIVSKIVSCLEPLKVAVNDLCRRVTNLISTQTALQFYIIQLQKQNDTLPSYSTCTVRLQQTATDIFEIPDKDAIKKFTRRLVGRLKHSVNYRWNNISRRQHSHWYFGRLLNYAKFLP